MGVEEGWPEAGGATELRGRDGARSPGSGRNGVSAGVVGGRSCSGVTDAPVGLPAWPRRPSVQGGTLGWQEKGAPGRGGRGARDVGGGWFEPGDGSVFPRDERAKQDRAGQAGARGRGSPSRGPGPEGGRADPPILGPLASPSGLCLSRNGGGGLQAAGTGARVSSCRRLMSISTGRFKLLEKITKGKRAARELVEAKGGVG